MGTRRDVASRRSAPSGHVATTTLQRGPFSRCHKVPFLLAISTVACRTDTKSVLGSPACAGIDPYPLFTPPGLWGFPRLRGDRPFDVILGEPVSSVPPPARG